MSLFLQLLLVSRPVSWLNTAYPFAAAYLMVFQAIDPLFVVGTVFFLVPYNLIMYGVNDVFDYDSDIQNPRKGGIEGAISAKRLHRPILLAAAFTGLPFLAALFLMGNVRSNLVLAGIMFFVLAYSVPVLRFKERAFLDSVTSSLHFVGPLLYALSFQEIPIGAYPMIAAFFLWGMASHAFGAVQDVVPDRNAGIGSIATSWGASGAVRLSLVLYAASGLLLIAYGWPAAAVSLVSLLYIANIWNYRTLPDTSADHANRAWKRFIYLNFIAGFVITMVLIYISMSAP